MRTTKLAIGAVVILLFSITEVQAQWSPTGFIDSVGINATTTIGSKVFVAGGSPGSQPVPLVSKRRTAEDGTDEIGSVIRGTSAGATSEAMDPLRTGVYLSTDSGATWRSAGLKDTVVVALASVGKDLFAATRFGGVLRSTDDGADWDNTGIGLVYYMASFAVDTSSNGGVNIYAARDNELFESSDTGSTWTKVGSGLPGTGGAVTALAASGPILFAATSTEPIGSFNGLYKSTDYGADWSVIDTIPTGQSIAIVGDDIYVATDGGFYLSTDGGTTWSTEDGKIGFNSIKVIRNNILAGTSDGIYRSIDYGLTWTQVGLNDSTGSDVGMLSLTPGLIFAAYGNHYHGDLPQLFLGPGSNVALAPISELTSVDEPVPTVPDGYALFQNYPNPFNPTTVISYQLSSASEVSVKVYDILGRAVETLVNERQGAGSHWITFDGSRLPSGVYFYRLRAGDYTRIMKMILLK